MTFWMIMAGLAWAQDPTPTAGGDMPPLNSQLLRPTVDGVGTFWLDDTAMRPSGTFTGRALLSWTNRPLVYHAASGEQTVLVDDVFQLNLLGGYTVGPVRFGLDVPVYLRSTGQAGGETGLGDLGLLAKGQILDGAEAPLGVALTGRLGLPTSTMTAALGADGVTGDFGVVADKKLGDTTVMANLGTRFQPKVALTNVVLNDQLFYGLGAYHELSADAGVSAELVGHGNLGGADAAGYPLETVLGGWFRPLGDALVLRGGLGLPLSKGIGAPASRVLLSVGWEPLPVYDADGDGVMDDVDACPDTPEDIDTWQDEDGCPEPTQVTLFFQDAGGVRIADVQLNMGDRGEGGAYVAQLDAGVQPLVAQAAGFYPVEADLEVPAGPPIERTYTMDLVLGHVVLHVTGPDGQPLPASVQIGAQHFDDQAAVETDLAPGRVKVSVHVDGYLERTLPTIIKAGEQTVLDVQLEKELAAVTAERIEIKDSVYFETAKAIIKPQSFTLLDQVATIMKDHPEITKLRVEGHTDSRGNDAYNMRLSKQRAASVLDYLVSQGVEAERLESEGYGETRPIDPANNREAWAKNRRVDFFIAARSDQPE